MKRIVLVFFVFAVSFSAKAQTNEAVTAYIDQYKQLAIDEMIRTGVPASITLAQGILESNAGQCPLVQASNNHFGIKCKNNWTGDVVYHDDDIKHECFRRYNSAEDSYRDHSDFLSSHSNYASLFDLDITDYTNWAYGLKRAGYATNPVYAISLITTIEKYNLEDVTQLALQESNQVTIAAAPVKMQEDVAFKNFFENPAREKIPLKANADIISSFPKGVFAINETKVVYATEGTSLFALVSNYGISYKKLLTYNDLDNVDILNHSTLIYLEKKPKRGAKDYHVALPNENLHDIAQEEGIQLESLLAYNNLQKSIQPKAGDKILLHGEGRKLF